MFKFLKKDLVSQEDSSEAKSQQAKLGILMDKETLENLCTAGQNLRDISCMAPDEFHQFLTEALKSKEITEGLRQSIETVERFCCTVLSGAAAVSEANILSLMGRPKEVT